MVMFRLSQGPYGNSMLQMRRYCMGVWRTQQQPRTRRSRVMHSQCRMSRGSTLHLPTQMQSCSETCLFLQRGPKHHLPNDLWCRHKKRIRWCSQQMVQLARKCSPTAVRLVAAAAAAAAAAAVAACAATFAAVPESRAAEKDLSQGLQLLQPTKEVQLRPKASERKTVLPPPFHLRQHMLVFPHLHPHRHPTANTH